MALRVPTGLALLSCLVGACTSSSAPAVPAVAESTCPGSVADAIGATCAVEGLVCSPEYACGILAATATCTCTAGSFACTDVTGKVLVDGGTPKCPVSGTTGTCPATEALASQRACTEPGLECAYPSTCSGSQEYDTCTCFTGPIADGGMGLMFQCPPPCDYDAALVDVGATSPNDSTSPDAPVIDAPHEASRADASAD